MTKRMQVLRGTGRAVVGFGVAASAAFGVFLLGSVQLPEVARTPQAITVDTTQDATRTLVCAGSFAELGADAARPDAAIPVGEPSVVVVGDPAEQTTLGRGEGGAGAPTVVAVGSGESLAAAQFQSVATESARGITAASCNEPANEQWLVGGATTTGVSTTLSIGNPGSVPATAQVTVYDENGSVSASQATSLRVPPGQEITVPINGYAPDRGRIAVHVASAGAAVTATLGVGHVIGLDPFAATTVTSQTGADTRLIVPGVTNVDTGTSGPNDTGDGDDFRVLVRVFAPGADGGSATVFALDAKGGRTELGSIEVDPGAVAELEVAEWPQQANAVVIEADVPVVGGVLASADNGDLHDYGWFAPAPEITADEPAPAAVVSGGKLVVANLGDAQANVKITGESGKPRSVTVPVGAAVVTNVPSAQSTILSDQPVYAGVRLLSGGQLDGYPVMVEDQRDGVLTVYTR